MATPPQFSRIKKNEIDFRSVRKTIPMSYSYSKVSRLCTSRIASRTIKISWTVSPRNHEYLGNECLFVRPFGGEMTSSDLFGRDELKSLVVKLRTSISESPTSRAMPSSGDLHVSLKSSSGDPTNPIAAPRVENKICRVDGRRRASELDMSSDKHGAVTFCLQRAMSTPNGIRTRAAALKGRCPRPLDDGSLSDTSVLRYCTR